MVASALSVALIAAKVVVVAGVVSMALVVVACCAISGRCSEWERDNLGE